MCCTFVRNWCNLRMPCSLTSSLCHTPPRGTRTLIVCLHFWLDPLQPLHLQKSLGSSNDSLRESSDHRLGSPVTRELSPLRKVRGRGMGVKTGVRGDLDQHTDECQPAANAVTDVLDWCTQFRLIPQAGLSTDSNT